MVGSKTTALEPVEARPNKQTHLTWLAFPNGLIVYKFEVIWAL